MQNAKYELFIEHVLFIHNLVIMFSYSDGTFYLWETNTWTSEQWSSTSGFVKVYAVYIDVLMLFDDLFIFYSKMTFSP